VPRRKAELIKPGGLSPSVRATVTEIGLDVDRPEAPDVLARLQAHPNVCCALSRRSAGGNLHFRVRLAAAVSVEDALTLRESLGDDPSRVACDRRRHAIHQTIDILYDAKGGRRAGPWKTAFAKGLPRGKAT
jgi:hypothetical protein